MKQNQSHTKNSIDPCKRIQDSLGFWIPRCGFRIPGTWFLYLSVEHGFWVLIISGIANSLSCNPDSKTEIQKQNFLWFRIPLAKFPGFRNPDSLAWGKLVHGVKWVRIVVAYHEYYKDLYGDSNQPTTAELNLAGIAMKRPRTATKTP